MISVTINNRKVSVKKGTTIYDACKKIGVFVPVLCHHPALPPTGECGVCVVKINHEKMVSSCVTVCTDGMIIETNTREVKQNSLNHFQDFVPHAMVEKTPEIEDLWKYYTGKPTSEDANPLPYPEQHNCSITWNPQKCVGCNKCIRVCETIQQIGAIDHTTHAFSDQCIKCGHCITYCPVQALSETLSTPDVLKALSSGKVCILQMAPSVRTSVAELFKKDYGTQCTGKIVAAAREIGFKYVFDVNFGADVTVMEEGIEFMQRLSGNGPLPIFTSCCPGWVNFVETKHPEVINNLSTAKSPHMMLGTLIKKYFTQVTGIKEEDIFLVSLMPCTSKKSEIIRPQHKGIVDAVITTNEFYSLIQHLDWDSLPDSNFDSMLSESTGAASIFGVTGGVAEAALRFCAERMTGQKLGPVIYNDLRGFDGIKSATVNINGRDINIAVINGIGNAHDFLNAEMQTGYDLVEVMACPGGCIGGGGQPWYKLSISKDMILQQRAKTLYNIDETKQNQGEITTNDNSELIQVYRNFIGQPCGQRAEQLLHTYYKAKL